MIRTILIVLVAAGVAALAAVALPPPAMALHPSVGAAPVRGVVHVHSRRSDGSGTVQAIAAAARRAGLAFVVFTDHGDATRRPDAPVYLDGVLCIDAVEISTDNGHLVALGLPQAPYPLGGEARDVVEDVARMGAFAIAAHPGSPKAALRWTAWDLPIDGLEWLNGDSEWRDESSLAIGRVLLTYPVRGAQALALLLDRPDNVMRRWDALTQRRRVVALAAADAHARLGTRGIGEGSQGGIAVHIPSYEQVFRTFSIALPQARLSGDARADADVVLGEIRRGHVFSSIDALAAPAYVRFTADSGSHHAVQGDTLVPAGAVTFRVDTDAPSGARIDLYKDGAIVKADNASSLTYAAAPARAVYRVEVALPQAPGAPPVPWMVSNPIYVAPETAPDAPGSGPGPAVVLKQYDNGPAAGWRVEHSVRSAAAFDVVRAVNGTQIAFRYALGGTIGESPFAALAMQAGTAISRMNALLFTAHADRPMRVSVQLRARGTGERWHRSVYLDTVPRQVAIPFDDMTPSGAARNARPEPGTIESVLWVVDTVNTSPGTSGQIWIDDVEYARFDATTRRPRS